MQKVFFLADRFGNQIVTRNSMKFFLDKLSSASSKQIVLDFKKRITEVNMNNEVRMMFKLVSLQYKRNLSLAV